MCPLDLLAEPYLLCPVPDRSSAPVRSPRLRLLAGSSPRGHARFVLAVTVVSVMLVVPETLVRWLP
jgi:hypothetical protein